MLQDQQTREDCPSLEIQSVDASDAVQMIAMMNGVQQSGLRPAQLHRQSE